ncbi:MAG TPA: DUF4347 domain-containing protein, partial [Gemmataceae bacterium]|nr:DUF4347 domain-containing protein [Gemmataceae bacterium]
MSSPILRCRLRQLYRKIRGFQKKKPAAGRPKPQFWLEELESRLAPASYSVNAQLAVSSLGQVGDAPGETHAVVFFESSVTDYQVLRQGLDMGTDAVLLDGGGDGFREMAAFLAGRHGLTSIGVVAHGTPGMVALGTALLDAHSLAGYTRELAVLGSALDRGGELDLWSCDVGAGQEGAALVGDLAATTGAGVAAADHAVGSAALGGNWQLDVRVAGATGDVPFSATAVGAFHHLLAVTIALSNNTAKGYVGLDFNQSNDGIPPDSNGAAGPSSYVETVNQTIAIYTPKATASTKITLGLDSFFASLPPVDSTAFFSDPVVVYDDNMPGLTPTTGRFIVGDVNVSSLASGATVFDIAVSKSANPGTLTSADWAFYQVNSTEPGFGADFPGNFGYNHDAFVFTLNQFGNNGPPDHVEVFSVSAADLATAVPPSQLHVFQNDVFNDISLRPTTMHDAPAGDPMWLLSETGDDTDINVYKMTNVLSNAATFTLTQVAVNPYTDMSAGLPKQPNGTVITSVIDSAIQKASEANNTLVADHSVSLTSTQDAAQWYVIDVSSGTPILQQEGDVSLGSNTYAAFPSIDINELGNIGMTFMESGTAAGHFMSMYITGRTPTDPMGTMETPVLVPAGTGVKNYSNGPGGRAGDISGINVD